MKEKTSFWSISAAEALSSLNTTAEGLTNTEATKRLIKFGQNTIKEKTRLARTAIALNQFRSPLILILLVAGIVTFAIKEFIDAIVIILALTVNTALGYWQENKAESVLEELHAYIRTQARVRRENQEREMDATKLVPGDIIHLSIGNRVPADARIISANHLGIDEAILTGESLPVQKTLRPVSPSAPLADRTCMLYGGTLVVDGYATAVVTATGENTEFGRIASLTAKQRREPTPLQRAVTRFAGWSGLAIIVGTLVLFISGIFSGIAIKDMFLIAVAVAVSAVPEGLPVAVTVILAVGVERLAKKKGVVRKMLAAETLGSTTVILTDKTGTLTEAKLSLSAILPASDEQDSEKELITAALLNTDVVLENPNAPIGEWRLSGRPLETAIVQAAGQKGIKLHDFEKQHKIIDRIPFNSTNKYSVTTARNSNGNFSVMLGAPEIILGFCETEEDGKKQILKIIDSRAKSGERLLGVARRNGTHDDKSQYSFLGLLAFRDPIRPSVKSAIERMTASGVQTVVVTGDHNGTATFVARELGLLNRNQLVITGSELEGMTHRDLIKRLKNIAVFARVSPEQKVQILNLYKEQGEIVAVTGDGVNDGPALKAADIGVAVGAGSEVAKAAADLILMDNNFETLVAAIEEGRRIIANIRKVIVYLLSNAMHEIFLIGGSLLAGLALPINALQILFVNFFSDSFPAISYAFETESDVHARTKRGARAIIDAESKILILFIGFIGSAVLLLLYLALTKFGFPDAIVRTFIFSSFSLYSLIVAFSFRSLHRRIGTYSIFSNHLLTISVCFGIGLTLAAVYAPFLQRILKTSALPPIWLLGVFIFAFINILLVEIVKWRFRLRRA
ncbi:MAG: HAD-IC family P-type ATPase [Patescibacteria group bacterium]